MKFHRLLLASAAVAAFAAAGAAFDENCDLVLYAGFDGDAAPQVARGGAALKSAAHLRFVPGKTGQAVYLTSPADLVYLPGIPLSSGSEWTIAMYVKPDAAGNAVGDGKGSPRYLFRTFGSGAWGDGDITASFGVWGKLDVSRFDGARQEVGSSIYANTFPAGDWTHLAVTSRDGRIRIYVNGVETKLVSDRTVSAAGAIQQGLRLGSSHPGDDNRLNGAIDEFKLFKRALDANEIKLIADTQPDGKSTGSSALPVLQVPFNGRVDASSPRGALTVSTDRVIFKPAVIGMGAEFSRHGYDARSVMTVESTGGLNGPELTAGFFFTPKTTPADDAARRGLLNARSGNVQWNLTRSGNELALTVSDGAGEDTVTADLTGLTAGKMIHIAAGYGKGELFLALDGRIAARAPFTAATAGDAAPSLLRVGDLPLAGQYDPTQAEGVIDELRIFDVRLTPERLLAESGRRNNPEAQDSARLTRCPVPFRPVTSAEAELWGTEGEFRTGNEFRTAVSLNGLWRFQPVADGSAPDAALWHYLAVPGRYAGHENGRSDVEFRIRKPDFSLADDRYLWNGVETWKLPTAYFERTFRIDPAWKNRQLRLVFDELSGSADGRLWINGKFAGTLPGSVRNAIPLDPARLNFDSDNSLLLEVVDNNERWNWRGVKGDVRLEALPELELARPRITTSVRNGRLQLSAEVTNHGRESAELRLAAAIEGENAPTPEPGAPVKAAPGQTVKLELAVPWSDAWLWDYEQPYLYNCTLSALDAEGKTVDRLEPIRFGFREFTIDGRDYRLNGKTLHIRNHDEWMNSTWDYQWCLQFVKLLKSLGYNALRGPFTDKDAKLDNIVRACDEGGLLLFLNAYGVAQREFTSWESDDVRTAMARRMENVVERYRNSPSPVMWYLSVNFLGYPWDYHPLKMADNYQPSFGQEKFRAAEEGAKLLNRLDGTRPFFFQAGGNFGPVINSNAYFCWWPEAEKRAWAEPWRKLGTKPLHVIETSFPYEATFFGMDLQNPGEKPLFVLENAARFFGQQAYQDVDAAQNRINDFCRTADSQNRWEFLGAYRDYPLVGKVKCRMLTDTVKAWRSSGISGICPFAELNYAFKRKSPDSSIHTAWSQVLDPGNMRTPNWHPDVRKYAAHLDIDPTRPLPLANALKEALNPLLLHILGPAGAPDSRAGNYLSGSRAERTVAAINDTLQMQQFRLEFLLDGRNVGSFDRELAPGEIIRIPVTFELPQVERTTTVRFEVRPISPEGLATDAVELRVMPEAALPETGIALWGDRAELPATGNPVDAAALDSLRDINLLVVGRRALTPEFSDWARRVGLADWVQQGGSVLLLEQTPEALSTLGLTARPVYLREVFPAADFPGLSGAELSNWHGTSTMAPHHAAPPSGSEERIPEQLWHYTAQDMVAAYPVRRPAAGALRALVTGGKDLNYAPVLEFRSGRGRVTVSQMELSGRSAEPAAGKLLEQLARRAQTPVPAAPVRPMYVLTTEGSDPAAEFGFRSEALPEQIPAESVILVNRELSAAEWSRFRNAAEAGAQLVFLTPAIEALRSLKLTAEPVEFHSLALTPEAKSFYPGLEARDLFFHYRTRGQAIGGTGVQPLSEPAAACMLPLGKGRLFFLLFDRTESEKHLAEAAKTGIGSSHFYAESINFDRIIQLGARLLESLGVQPACRLEQKLEQPDLEAARLNLDGEWLFRFDPENTGSVPPPTDGWTRLQVPGYWENQTIPAEFLPKGLTSPRLYDGVAWYARTVELPAALRGRDLRLEFGAIDDLDVSYVNGVEVGRTGEETPGYWMAQRRYPIPAKLTLSGRLTILVKVNDLRGNGGIPGHAALVEATPGEKVTPYGSRPQPQYNTESAIRW